jgi:hypothetical protein
MERPPHTFKIGQQVYHHAGGLPGGQRTGPYTIIGIVWQSGGTVRYRIKSSKHEQLAHESELKLALKRKDTNE